MTDTLPTHDLRAPTRPAPVWWTAADAAPDVATDTVRCVSINTHRGRGPDLRCVARSASPDAARRAELLHATRAYAFHVAEWIRRRSGSYDVVALQEVLHGILGFDGTAFLPRHRQRDYYRELTGYASAIAHRVGFTGFRYENALLSRLEPAREAGIQAHLPCRVLRLAACGFTLAPFRVAGRTAWIGNTHLHSMNPQARMRQAAAIARYVRRLGDVPVVFLGDLNAVPPGCRDRGFDAGDRDERSYLGDRTLEILERAGLRTVAHEDSERYWTYPTGAPNRTLDYVLASRHWDVAAYGVVHDFALSDHLPVEATLRLVR